MILRRLYPPDGVRLGDWAAYADRLAWEERFCRRTANALWPFEDLIYLYIDPVYRADGRRK